MASEMSDTNRESQESVEGMVDVPMLEMIDVVVIRQIIVICRITVYNNRK